MKKLLFFIPLMAFAQSNQTSLGYALLDVQGNILETFVATPEVAATYPACVQQIYPTAVSCVLAPVITPSVTTNNTVALPAVTTNNISILTTNNSQ
jgi:hypothetical protein